MVIRVKRCIRLRVRKEILEKGEHVQFLGEKKENSERTLGKKNAIVDFRRTLLLISEEQSKVMVEFIFSNLKYVFLKIGFKKL